MGTPVNSPSQRLETTANMKVLVAMLFLIVAAMAIEEFDERNLEDIFGGITKGVGGLFKAATDIADVVANHDDVGSTIGKAQTIFDDLTGAAAGFASIG